MDCSNEPTMHRIDIVPAIRYATIPMKRLFHIDLARTVAILLVTTYHLSRVYPVDAKIGAFDLYGLFRHGYLGVDIFFVVSGYVMAMTWERQTGNFATRARSFLRSRLLRLMPAYIVAIMFWVAVITATGFAQKPVGPFHIVSHLIFTHTFFPSSFFSVSGVMWSLAVEVHFYLLFPLLALLSWRQRCWLVSFCILAAGAATLFVPQSHPFLYPLRWNVITFFPLFMLGVFIHETRDWKLQDNGWIFWPIIAGAVVFMMMVEPFDTNVVLRLALGGAIGLALVAASPFRSAEGLAANAIKAIAAASYSIYLYNYVLFFIGSALSGLVGMVCGVVFVFAFGGAMWWVFDRNFEKARHRRKAGLSREAV